MSSATLDNHVRQFNEIVRQLVRLKTRLKPVQAEGEALIRMRKQLIASHPHGKAGTLSDIDYVFHIGTLLAGKQNSLTMHELSQALAVPDSTATRIVDWLVKSGYAERQSDPTDRRVVRVTLTDPGQAMYRILNEHICDRIKQLLQILNADERGSLITLLSKIVTALEEEHR